MPSDMQRSKSGMFGKLRALDAYPKINEDFFTKTFSGGIITVASTIVMILLFLNETRLFLVTDTVHELVVDTSRGETIDINLDVTFPHMPCSWLSLDAMDASGETHLDVDHDIYKQRLSKTGNPVTDAEKHDVHATKKEPEKPASNSTEPECGSCYGAEDADVKCCNTCDEVRTQYRKKGWAVQHIRNLDQCKHDTYLEMLSDQEGEGCRMWGKLVVAKVAGNFHFAPGRSFQQGPMHIHDLAPFMGKTIDFTHTINGLSFGEPYPGRRNPLDHVDVKVPALQLDRGTGMYQYFLKVVPTVYVSMDSSIISSNQFSVTENYRDSSSSGGGGRPMPGLFFMYDLSPIKVSITERKSSFLHFLTNVCAIVGGIFTVAGILDAFIYHGELIIRKKRQMGKLG